MYIFSSCLYSMFADILFVCESFSQALDFKEVIGLQGR